jgi:protein-tyrosine phosphatase
MGFWAGRPYNRVCAVKEREDMRVVELPSGIRGQLYLHHMPGRYNEPIKTFLAEAAAGKIDCVVCLVRSDEIPRKSPAYANLLEGGVSWDHVAFPIMDFDVPEDRTQFCSMARSIANRLRDGRSILIHCGAGQGRTGMMAIGVLMALGHSRADATRRIASLGSGPETDEQKEWMAALREGCEP